MFERFWTWVITTNMVLQFGGLVATVATHAGAGKIIEAALAVLFSVVMFKAMRMRSKEDEPYSYETETLEKVPTERQAMALQELRLIAEEPNMLGPFEMIRRFESKGFSKEEMFAGLMIHRMIVHSAPVIALVLEERGAVAMVEPSNNLN